MTSNEIQEHPALLGLYALALMTPLALWAEAPSWARALSWAGGISLTLLALRLVLVGFTGYERTIGLRIIRRGSESDASERFWLRFFGSTAALAIAVLLMLDGELLQPVRVGLVFYAAVASFFGLLDLIGRRFSVFGTTSIIGIVLGVAALLVVQSVATGFQHEFERRVLGVYAHINVTRGFGISEYRRFEAWLRTLDGVEGASPFVYYAMTLADDRGERGVEVKSVLVKGIEPETAAQVIDLPDHLERGSGRPIPLTDLRSDHELMPVPDRPQDQLPIAIAATPDPRGADWYDEAIAQWSSGEHHRDRFRLGPGRDTWEDPPQDDESIAEIGDIDRSTMPTMFIGVVLARELQLAEGDVVRLVDPGTTFDPGEAPKFADYVIAGVFQAGFQEYDSRLVYIDIGELQRFKYRGKDLVSGIDLRLRDRDLAPEVGAEIRNELDPGEYSIVEWQELNESLFSSIRQQKSLVTVILSLVIVVASFNVLSALWTMVVRRTADVAILMSMGATGPQVARIFQATGVAIGLAGSLAGVAFGLILCWLVQLYGYTLDPEVYLIEELPVEISLIQIGWILGLALTSCFVVTLPASLRAARLRPVEGLRFE